MKLPLTVIGGYLGAGKTTLVNHLLRNADGLRLAVLVNEFGELPIDQDLIEAQDENIISIAGGCVCCSYGNDLALALIDLLELKPQPDHVLLEASGVAMPGAIAASVSLLSGYQLDGIVVMSNAETIFEQAHDHYISDTIERQLASADLLVLNKVDLVSDAKKIEIEQWLRHKTGNAEIVPAHYGKLPQNIVLNSFNSHHFTGELPTEHQSGLFSSLSIPLDQPIDAEQLASGLAAKALALVRAKGFAITESGEKFTLQVVGRRWSVTPTAANRSTGLVVIAQSASFKPQLVLDLVQHCTVRQ